MFDHVSCLFIPTIKQLGSMFPVKLKNCLLFLLNQFLFEYSSVCLVLWWAVPNLIMEP